MGDDPVRGTYLSVRLILPVLAGFIAAATVLEAVVSRHLRGSISEYYQGPVRDVFVGGLVGVAACLVAYQGASKLEDYVLNFAGFNAVVVALVPDNLAQVLRDAPQGLVAGDVVLSRGEIVTNLQISLGAFLVAAVALVVVDRRTMPWTPFDWEGATSLARWLVRLSWVAELLLVAVLVAVMLRVEVLLGRPVVQLAHVGAATLFIVFLGFAVASHAWPTRLRPETMRAGDADADHRVYRLITVLMAVGLVGGLAAIAAGVPYAVITTEYTQIVLFVWFWVRATRRAWLASRRA